MEKSIEKGEKVFWKWENGKGRGKVIECYHKPIYHVLQGAHISRNGTAHNPAYLIEQENGHQVLKLHSELIL